MAEGSLQYLKNVNVAQQRYTSSRIHGTSEQLTCIETSSDVMDSVSFTFGVEDIGPEIEEGLAPGENVNDER